MCHTFILLKLTKKALLTMVVYFEAVVCKYDLAIEMRKKDGVATTPNVKAHTPNSIGVMGSKTGIPFRN